MYKIAICDDSVTDVDYITKLVREWAKSCNKLIHIDTFPSGEAFLFHYEEDKDYHILLLDIEMKEINGVDLARRVRSKDKEVQIIFITGYMDYISDGYDVEALHYILKPVQVDKLNTVLQRACGKLKMNERAFVYHTSEKTVRIPLYEIRYVEVSLNYITIHEKENHTVKMTLSKAEKELDESFFRIGRSFLVNLRYIRKITRNEVILDDDSKIPLSRGFYEPLNQAFITYN